MRLSLPSRVPLSKVFVFASLFWFVQLLEHTSFVFSLLYFAFLILTAVAFNLGDGFARLTGAYIFWYSTLIVIVGVTWKAVVGEPGETNLYTPVLDMSLYTMSMVMLALVAIVNKKVDVRSMGLGGGFDGSELNYTSAGLGCVILGVGIMQLQANFGQAPGGIVSALVQVNAFPSLGIILATIGAIKDSGGRRSTNYINIFAMGFMFYGGLIGFTKQGMFTPVVCWVVGSFYARLKVRPIHIVAMILIGIVSFGFLAPLSTSRDLVEGIGDSTERLEVIGYQLTHWTQFEEHVHMLEVEDINLGGGEGATTARHKVRSFRE